MNLLIKQEEQEEQEESLTWGIPICGANLSSPIVDQARFVDEIRYKIGNRLYIENVD